MIKNFIKWVKNNPIWSVLIYICVILLFLGNKKPEGSIVGITSLLTSGLIIFSIWAIIQKGKNMKGHDIIKQQKQQKKQDELLKITQSIKDDTFIPLQVDIPLEKEENAYGVYGTALIKEKKVTTKTNYGGMTGSIKIMKGIRYRAGSIGHSSESHMEEYRADIGTLYVTNKRFIFKGDKQVVEIKAKDMMTMEVKGNQVKIFKKKGNAIKFEFIGDYGTFGAVMMGLNNQ